MSDTTYNKPYPGGWKDAPDLTTAIDHVALDKVDAGIDQATNRAGVSIRYDQPQTLAAPDAATARANMGLGTIATADASSYVPTTRAVNGKPLSADVTLAASDVSAVPTSAKGAANGVATLDGTTKVPSAQVPDLSSSYVTLTARDLDAMSPLYGAVGNGTTDDTTALQNAINAAAAGGARVFLRPGHTFLASQIQLLTNTGIYGGGIGETTILHKAGSTTDLIVLHDNTVLQTSIRSLTINGNAPNQTSTLRGIYLDHTGGSSTILPSHIIEDVYVYQPNGDGLTLGAFSRRSVVDRVNVYKANGYGVVLAGADSKVSNVDVGQSGLDGWLITGGAYLISSVKSWYSGQVTPASHGFNIQGQTIVINGAHSQDNGADGFHVFKAGTQIQGLVLNGVVSDNDANIGVFLFNAQDAVVRGLVKTYSGGTNNVPVSGLSIDSSSAGCDIAMSVSGQSSWAVTSGSVTAGHTIEINGRRNRQLALTGATITPNPWTAETITSTLTSAVTIANPGVTPAGLKLRLILTQDGVGGRVVAFGTNFSLNGSTPNTAAGKINIYDFVCNGSKWLQTGLSTI